MFSSLECLQWLLEEGKGHAYQTATDGMAPIHAAAQAGHLPCLEYLVKQANVSVRSRADDGATPAHFAAASGQVNLRGLTPYPLLPPPSSLPLPFPYPAASKYIVGLIYPLPPPPPLPYFPFC